MTQQMIRNVLPGWTKEYKRLDSWINETEEVVKKPKHLSEFGIGLYAAMLEIAVRQRATCKRTIRQYLEALGEKPRVFKGRSAAEVKASVDLVEFVSRYTGLKEWHGKHWGKCPLHREKTASFIVSGQRWHCFGCNESGDVFDLVRKINSCSFKEALQKVRAV
ncbi:MAG TPA: hypothetical protein DDW41_02055 [Candidatus Andersenbacteria bacterium]|nr:hypothetical protein [Candidatus Andersenbacteria bacterium]